MISLLQIFPYKTARANPLKAYCMILSNDSNNKILLQPWKFQICCTSRSCLKINRIRTHGSRLT